MSVTEGGSRTRLLAGVVLWKWLVLLLGLVLLILALVIGGSSSSAVASVNGQSITLSTYNRWLISSAVTAHESEKSVPASVPVGPDFTACVAFERKQSTAKTPPSVATLRGDCRAYRNALAENVMQFLLGGEWFLDEGAREHVTVTAAQVTKSVKSSFSKTSTEAHFLKTNGLQPGDLEFEARARLVAQKLYAKVSGPTPTITTAQITSYYNANKSEMDGESLTKATPVIRELLISEKEEPSIATLVTKMRNHWRPLTSCAAGYRLDSYCRTSS